MTFIGAILVNIEILEVCLKIY